MGERFSGGRWPGDKDKIIIDEAKRLKAWVRKKQAAVYLLFGKRLMNFF